MESRQLQRLFTHLRNIITWCKALFKEKGKTKNNTIGKEAPKTQKVPDNKPSKPLHLTDQKWKEYREKGGVWNHKRWVKTYNDTMRREIQNNIVLNKYHGKMGDGEKELTIDLNGKPRKLDSADADTMKGTEIKSRKYVSRSKEILKEIVKDEALIKKGWQITWKIDGKASQPLFNELTRAGIAIIN